MKKSSSFYLKLFVIVIFGIAISTSNINADDTRWYFNTAKNIQGPYNSPGDCERQLEDYTKKNNLTAGSAGACEQKTTTEAEAIKASQTNAPVPISSQAPVTQKKTIYRLLAPIPGLTCIDDTGSDKNCVKGGIGEYLNIIFKIGIGLCGVLAVVMLVINFIGYMSSESFTEKANFKQKFWGPIGGLLLALGAYAILTTINPALTGKEGLTIDQVGVTVEDQLALSYSGIEYQIIGSKVTPIAGTTLPTGEELQKIQSRYVSATKSVRDIYIPTLNKTLPNISKGVKTLMIAQTTIEGFKPGTKSYDNNNPGNLGTDWVRTGRFATLEEGILKQYDYITRVINGQHKAYPLGKRLTQPTSMVGTHSYPAIDFNPYTGTLSQYLNIYDAGTRTSNSYLNFIISYFAKEGMTITPNTTLESISKM